MRNFETGATRDSEEGKLDYEGFLSPSALERYAKYMHKHRLQANGELRDSDNWQNGIPLPVYMKSLWRHFMDVWKLHRYIHKITQEKGFAQIPNELEEALCAILFNTFGYLHEIVPRVNVDEEASNPIRSVQDNNNYPVRDVSPSTCCSNERKKVSREDKQLI